MGFLDTVKSDGRGLASIPGRINEARFSRAEPMIAIGTDPDTGEPIMMKASDLEQQGGAYNPSTGEIQHFPTPSARETRTGKSKFVAAIPRMLQAGIAGATSDGDRFGNGGGARGFMKGMAIGDEELQKRDMMAYNMARQRSNDARQDKIADARIQEDQAQAQMYKRRAQEEAVPKAPSTYEQMLVQQLQAATDPAQAAAIEKKIMDLRRGTTGTPKRFTAVGSNMWDDQEKKFITPPADPNSRKSPTLNAFDVLHKRAIAAGHPEGSPGYKSFMQAGGRVPGAGRGRPGPGGLPTEAQKMARVKLNLDIESRKVGAMAKAHDEAEKEKNELRKDQKLFAEDNARIDRRRDQKIARAQREYENEIRMAKGEEGSAAAAPPPPPPPPPLGTPNPQSPMIRTMPMGSNPFGGGGAWRQHPAAQKFLGR